MTIFYNIIGILNLAIAVMMLRCGTLADESREEFKLATKALHIVFMLTGLSMFAAQFEQRLEYGEFQLLNPLMLLFFYSIGQGIIYTLLVLFKTKYTKKYMRHTVPVFFLFALYTIAYLIFDDKFIYSFNDFFLLLPRSPMLMFRCVLLLSILVSIVYGVIVCHKACRENHKHIADSFSEAEFQRGIFITKFMWSVKALSIWSVLAYFYTTPTLEIVSCSLITIVFAFQFLGFKDFLLSHNAPNVLSLLAIPNEINFEVDGQEMELKQRLQTWVEREDKPYTQGSITIIDVAKEIGMPKNRLSAHINGMEVTFPSWINNLRIEEAKQLLLTRKDMTISEVAESLGFCDLPAFSRAFKKITGVTPKSFRSNHEIPSK